MIMLIGFCNSCQFTLLATSEIWRYFMWQIIIQEFISGSSYQSFSSDNR